jgi:hypothetical protein
MSAATRASVMANRGVAQATGRNRQAPAPPSRALRTPPPGGQGLTPEPKYRQGVYGGGQQLKPEPMNMQQIIASRQGQYQGAVPPKPKNWPAAHPSMQRGLQQRGQPEPRGGLPQAPAGGQQLMREPARPPMYQQQQMQANALRGQ